MSLFRRRLLIQNSLKQQDGGGADLGYVKDGLIMHLDGINKGNDPTAWTDLVQGVKFTYKDVIINDDNIQFDGKKSHAFTKTMVDTNKKTSTIEICMTQDSALGYRIIYSPMSPSMIGIAHNNYQMLLSTESEDMIRYEMINPKPDIITLSANRNLAVENTKKLGPGGSTFASYSTVATVLGGRLAPDLRVPFSGKIYAVRVYNRLLTQEEMTANQQIDSQRFNITF